MILRITPRLPPTPGGLELHARELTLTQAGRDFGIELAFAEGNPVGAEGVVNRRVEPLGRAVFRHSFMRHRFALTVTRNHALGGAATRIVHAHGDYAVAWAATAIAARLGCPSVVTIHGALSERRLHRALGRRIYPRLDRIIAVSPAIRDQLVDIGVPCERIAVVSSGIHYARFAPNAATRESVRAEFGATSDEIFVLSVGRLHAVKGFEHLLASAELLRERAPGVRIVIAGGGPEESRLRRQARRLPNVHLIGQATHGRVAELLVAADVFVLPSVQLGTQAEGMPTSVMEAMAAGLPIVATRTGGIPHLVEDGVNGLLVPPASAPSLASAIESLANAARTRQVMGERNQLAVKERDWSIIADRVTEVYRDAGWTITRGVGDAARSSDAWSSP